MNRFWVAAAVVLMAMGVGAEEPAKRPFTVFAAASLTEPMQRAVKLYELQAVRPVRCSFGASGMLAKQIANGAPADLFISANQEWMDFLEKDGRIAEGSRENLFANRLSVIRPRNAKMTIAKPEDIASASRVAIGDPANVPAGAYAKQFLERRGLWEGLQGRLVFALNVRAALMLVERGEVDAGIVFTTDALSSESVERCFEVDAADHDPIVYPAGIVKDGLDAALARDFLDFLRNGAGKDEFTKYGYSLANP